MREAQFGSEFKILEKLLETNAVFNRKVDRAGTKLTRALSLFSAHVTLHTESATGQQIHAGIVAPFGFVLEQQGEVDPGRFAYLRF